MNHEKRITAITITTGKGHHSNIGASRHKPLMLTPYMNATIHGKPGSGRTTEAVSYIRSLATSPGPVNILVITDDPDTWTRNLKPATLSSVRPDPKEQADTTGHAHAIIDKDSMQDFTKSIHQQLSRINNNIDKRSRKNKRPTAENGTSIIILDDYDTAIPCISEKDQQALARIINEGEPYGCSVITIINDDPIMNRSMWGSLQYRCTKTENWDGTSEYEMNMIPC